MLKLIYLYVTWNAQLPKISMNIYLNLYKYICMVELLEKGILFYFIYLPLTHSYIELWCAFPHLSDSPYKRFLCGFYQCLLSDRCTSHPQAEQRLPKCQSERDIWPKKSQKAACNYHNYNSADNKSSFCRKTQLRWLNNWGLKVGEPWRLHQLYVNLDRRNKHSPCPISTEGRRKWLWAG